MAHTTLILDTRSAKKDGTYPLKIRVSHKGEFYFALKIYLFPEQLENGTVIDHPLAARHNNLIATKKLEIDRKLIELQESGELDRLTSAQLKQILTKPGTNPAILLSEYLVEYLTRVHNANTRSSFEIMFSKIAKFCNAKILTFDEISPKWLTKFDEYMIATGMSTNARSVYMRALRRLFNAALDDELIVHYPFRKFKIKQEETAKRSLTLDELRTLRDYPCEPHQEKYRDLFMLIFYLIGINTVDLFNLKEVRNGRIEFRRSKTGRLFSIKVEPEAQVIIDKYRGNAYLLDILDAYANYKDFAHRMNLNLQQIGPAKIIEDKAGKLRKKERTPIFPKLSTYWARHTWATLAAELDIPDETISMALGHAGSNRTTNIYINRNTKKVDEANRKVLDHVLGIARK